jgi:raffinose/stachyose/melibiose transport system substrate-binding protein
MKKLSFVGVVLTLALCVMLAGCQKKETATGQSTSNKVTIRVLNYLDLTSANSQGEITEVWEKFAADHPDIAIEREDLFNEPFHQKTEAYAASGNLPDVMYAWPSGRSTTLHSQHLLKDLTPLLQQDGLTSKYTETALDPTQEAAGYVGILTQSTTSSHAFYVNTAVLQAAGLEPAKTYDDLKAQVAILKAKGIETVLMANQDTWVMQSCLFSLLAGRFGGAGWDQKILNGQAKFTDADFLNSLKFVKQLYDDGVLSQSSLSTSYGDVIGEFATSKGAYLIDGDWRVGAFITDQSTGQALISPAEQAGIQITVFPDIASAKLNKSSSVVLGTGWGINASIPAGSAQEAAAWELVKWLAGREIQTYRLNTGGIATPSRTDINSADLKFEPMQTAISNLGTQFTTATCVVDGVFHSDVYNPLNDGLQAIGLGTKTPEQVAAEVQAAFDTWKAAQ